MCEDFIEKEKILNDASPIGIKRKMTFSSISQMIKEKTITSSCFKPTHTPKQLTKKEKEERELELKRIKYMGNFFK